MTKQSAKELCEAYEHSTGRPWIQSLGFEHALFEVAIDVLKRAKNLGEPASILEAIVATDYHSVVGPIKWSGKPVKNVSKTPLVAGQWRKREKGFELVICEVTTAPNIKAQEKLRLLAEFHQGYRGFKILWVRQMISLDLNRVERIGTRQTDPATALRPYDATVQCPPTAR